ncbi:MAG TPA: GMC oxidoreductase, partial [Longimicrobiales bacterium]
ALTLLAKGYEVTMLDAGVEKPMPVEPQSNFDELRERLADPVAYLLGEKFDALTLPGQSGDFYAFPPSKRYVFEQSGPFNFAARGFEPLFSFARGGLAEAWTGGVYPLNDAELKEFPFGHADLAPYYDEVARRIGINGAADDLARFFPVHDHMLNPLKLGNHATALLNAYGQRRDKLNAAGCYFGRSRIATLTQDKGDRPACSYCARCLWGCATGALYTPSSSLRECMKHPNFRYAPNTYVSHFRYDAHRQITAVVTMSTTDGARAEVPTQQLVLAAGTLSSSRIFLESIYRGTGEVLRLDGLMDNQQILIPYVNMHAIGAAYDPNSYQFHQVAMGLEGARPEEYVHSQITAMTTALVHPLVQKLPLDLRGATAVFRSLRSSLGIINVNLHDRRRPQSYLTIEPGNKDETAKLVIDYVSDPAEAHAIRAVVSRIRGVMLKLGCVVAPGMTHIRPKGAGVHYAGTVPMSRAANALRASEHCRSHDFDNLFFVDGTTYPFLPAKNITFTLMANAVRVADQVF